MIELKDDWKDDYDNIGDRHYPYKVYPKELDIDIWKRPNRPINWNRRTPWSSSIWDHGLGIPVRYNKKGFVKELELFGEIEFNIRNPEKLLLILGQGSLIRTYDWKGRYWESPANRK